MTTLWRAGATALVLATGGIALPAVAQTATESTTTTTTYPAYAAPAPGYVATVPAQAPVYAQAPAVPPPVVPPAPPPGTLATEHESHAVDALGNRRDERATTYRNPNGVAEDSRTVTTRVAPPPPPPPPVSTTTSTTTTTTGPQE